MSPPKVKRSIVEAYALDIWTRNPDDIAVGFSLDALPAVCSVWVRGYRRDTMGKIGENDPGIWDDAAFLLTKTGTFLAENANADPSRFGWNPGIDAPYAQLVAGRVWWMYPGAHKGVRPAFRQADDEATAAKLGIPHKGRFLVTRIYGNGDPRNKTEWGHQQINIHPGGEVSTSSWACLTLPKSRAKSWLQAATDALKAHHQALLPVILVEGPIC